MTITNDFFNKLLKKNEEQGVWENKLNDEWLDTQGWNVITQPQLGNPAKEDFAVRVDQMRETITFKFIGGRARNIGVTGQAGFWQAISYEVDVKTPKGESIHHEMGHFLLNVLKDGETEKELEGNILRQASIPHANSMLTAGILKPESITDAIDAQVTVFYNAKPSVDDEELQAKINDAFDAKQEGIMALGGPDFEKPLVWLGEQFTETVKGRKCNTQRYYLV